MGIPQVVAVVVPTTISKIETLLGTLHQATTTPSFTNKTRRTMTKIIKALNTGKTTFVNRKNKQVPLIRKAILEMDHEIFTRKITIMEVQARLALASKERCQQILIPSHPNTSVTFN